LAFVLLAEPAGLISEVHDYSTVAGANG